MNNKKLSLALKMNAIFSAVNGVAILLFHQQIAAYINFEHPKILLAIGIVLIGFSALVYRTARASIISKQVVKFIIFQDWLWVIGSVLIIALQAFGINRTGLIIIGVIALIVADFAFFQQRYLKANS